MCDNVLFILKKRHADNKKKLRKDTFNFRFVPEVLRQMS